MTQRVSLRPLTAADASEMFAAVRESIDEISYWMPWCYPAYSLQDAHIWIQTTIDGHATGAMYDFGIFDQAGRYAGSCGINQIRELEGTANLGYWIRSSLTGRGLAPEAVRQLIAWTFANTKLQRIEIIAAIGNTRSQRVAEKAGAERDAVLKKRLLPHGVPSDAVLYSVV